MKVMETQKSINSVLPCCLPYFSNPRSKWTRVALSINVSGSIKVWKQSLPIGTEVHRRGLWNCVQLLHQQIPVKSLQLRKWPSQIYCDRGGSFVFILVFALQLAWTRMPTPTYTSHFSISTSVLVKVTKTYSWKMEKTSSRRQMYQNHCV